jgi:hypothetical protein
MAKNILYSRTEGVVYCWESMAVMIIFIFEQFLSYIFLDVSFFVFDSMHLFKMLILSCHFNFAILSEIWHLTGVLPSVKTNISSLICDMQFKWQACELWCFQSSIIFDAWDVEINVGEKYVSWEYHGPVFSSYLHLNHFLPDNVVRL